MSLSLSLVRSLYFCYPIPCYLLIFIHISHAVLNGQWVLSVGWGKTCSKVRLRFRVTGGCISRALWLLLESVTTQDCAVEEHKEAHSPPTHALPRICYPSYDPPHHTHQNPTLKLSTWGKFRDHLRLSRQLLVAERPPEKFLSYTVVVDVFDVPCALSEIPLTGKHLRVLLR